MQTTIDNAGRMVIPKPIRERAGLRPGMPLDVHYRHGRVEIEPIARPIELVRKGDFTVARAEGASPLSNEQVSGIIEEVRDGKR